MRPIGIPEWANDLSNIVEPAQGKKDTGHVPSEQPSAGFENWLKNLLSTYARELGNAGFSQLRSAFATLTPDATYFPTGMAHRIGYGEGLALFAHEPDLWIITNSNGSYELVDDPYSKQSATNYQHEDFPGSADDVAIRNIIHNDIFDAWIAVGDESSQAPYTSEPKIARTTVEFPGTVSWTATNVGLPVNLTGLDYSTVTGTTIAAGSSGTILRSTDGGVVWTDVSPGGDLVRGLSVYSPKSSANSARGEFVVTGTDVSTEFVGLFSDDDGLTWTYINVAGLLSQTTSDSADVSHNGRLWVCLNGAGPEPEILTSADGLSWSASILPSAISASLTPRLAADEAGGLIFLSAGFYSETDGQSWKYWTGFKSPDPLADNPAPETFQPIVMSATGQICVTGAMDQRVVAWFTPKQIMRNASYDNPDL